jgi:uncharacterized integral membrane protein
MNLRHRTPAAEQSTVPSAEPAGNTAPDASPAPEVPLTRAGAAWVGLSAAAVVAILLIIFLVQNTHQVQVNFLGMSTSTSLALMLLIAAVAGIFLTSVLGTARMVQLRRIIRRR